MNVVVPAADFPPIPQPCLRCEGPAVLRFRGPCNDCAEALDWWLDERHAAMREAEARRLELEREERERAADRERVENEQKALRIIRKAI